MLNSVVGQVARGDKYFDRPYITKMIWEIIENGNNILISAPRRVGKSSLMCHLLENPKLNSRLLYITTESVDDDNEFFKRLFYELVSNISGIQKYTKQFTTLIKRFGSSIESLGKDGIKLKEGKIDYFEEFKKLLKSIDLEGDKIIIMIDEYAQTVENIKSKINPNKAKQFLEKNRELRHEPQIIKKVKFIYAGSISLQAIVDNINSSHTTNDLCSFDFKPFSIKESRELIDMIMNGSEYKISDRVTKYLIEQVEWLIPFHIQIILDEANKYCIENDSFIFSQKVIDEAIKSALNIKNYFQHWNTRLKKVLKGKDYKFANELLNNLSNSELMEIKDIINIAQKYKVTENYKNIIYILEYDGYINNKNESKVYKFNSPILKLWWNKNVAN
jgi:uncharacterized protein